MSRRTDFVYAWCEVLTAELLRRILAFWGVTPRCCFPTFRRNVMPSYWGSSSPQVLCSMTWEDSNTLMFASCVWASYLRSGAGRDVSLGMTMTWACSEMLKRKGHRWSSGRQVEIQWELWGAREWIPDPPWGTVHSFDCGSRFKAWWLLCVPKSLTFRNSVFFSHSAYLYSHWSHNEQRLFQCTALSDLFS